MRVASRTFGEEQHGVCRLAIRGEVYPSTCGGHCETGWYSRTLHGVPSLDRISELVAAIAELGIIEITLSDTIGVANPRQVLDVFSSLRAQHKKIRFGAHFHDTRGLALANAVAALDAGIELFDSSVGGLGGCPYAPGATGNVATEDFVYMFEAMGITTGISLPALLDAAQFVGGLVQHSLSARTRRDLL